jgi:hypothetical protein
VPGVRAGHFGLVWNIFSQDITGLLKNIKGNYGGTEFTKNNKNR